MQSGGKRSTRVCQDLHERPRRLQVKRRIRVVHILPNPARCLRLVRALCPETREAWLEDHRYLNMDYLSEQKKDLMHLPA